MADLYPYLILIGGSILVATAWLLWQARGRAHITNELVSLNESLGFDLPDFLRRCWKPLAAAGFKGFDWELNWFGTVLTGSEGSPGEVMIQRRLDVDEISLTINLYDGKRRFEQRYFSTALSESFFLLLHMDMWIKLGTVQGAFAQTAKLTVFLQHDMKNVVQLISLVAEQLEAPPRGNEEKLLSSLRTVMPTLRERAERFLSSLSSQAQAGKREVVDLGDAVHNTAKIHDLSVQVHGSGETLMSASLLTSILDNLFGNYVDQLRRNPSHQIDLQVHIEARGELLEMTLRDSNGAPCSWPERLFEPFWSEKGSGLGIGLYHARQLAMAQGGSLRAEAPVNSALT
ncbi:MAG: hypothetical protein RLZZ385_46, partial [Pseudomonadota bacterium]